MVWRRWSISRTRDLLGKTREALVHLRKALERDPGDQRLVELYERLTRKLEASSEQDEDS